MGLLSHLSPSESEAPAGLHQCLPRGAIHRFNATAHRGDLLVPAGQSYVIANLSLHIVGNIIVDGGVLIVRDAKLTGHAFPVASWIVQRGGCMEFTRVHSFIVDDLVVGGRLGTFTHPDMNSTLIINNSTMLTGVSVTGSNATVTIANSILQNFVKFTPFWPANASRVEISNSLIGMIGLGFDGFQAQAAQIRDLRPGHFTYWQLHSNLTLFKIPYELTLRNVTVIPNRLGPGPWGSSIFGWAIGVRPNHSFQWPNVTVINSEVTSLEFNWVGSKAPIVFRDIPSVSPVTLTFFDAIRLVNTSVTGQLTTGFWNSNVTYINGGALGIFALGRSNVTLINSTITDFNPWNNTGTFTFINSSWGIARPIRVEEIPYHRLLPNASFWASARGFGTVWNSNIRMLGNLTQHVRPPPYTPQWRNATVIRVYPIIVTDASGQGSVGATVGLHTAGDRILRQQTTNEHGRADVAVLFEDGNWTSHLVLTGSAEDARIRRILSFSTDTPIRLVMPRTTTHAVEWQDSRYLVTIVSNSSISAFGFQQEEKQLSYLANGPTATFGFSNVTIPKALMSGTFTVFIDEMPAAPSLRENATHTRLFLTYPHSTRTIRIVSTHVIPELPSSIVIALILASGVAFALTLRLRFFGGIGSRSLPAVRHLKLRQTAECNPT